MRAPLARLLLHFKTSALGFTIWWIVIFLLHAVNIAYYVLAAHLYRTVGSTSVSFQLNTYSIGIPPSTWPTVATIHAVIAAIHALFLVAMVVGSLQARQLVFQPTMRSSKSTNVSKGPQRQLDPRVARCIKAVGNGFRAVFAREGFLGVDSVYFDHLQLLLELVNTALLLIQVYRMTFLLPRVWLVRAFVLLLVAKCWSIPVVFTIFRKKETKRRMVMILCDAVVDVAASIGISFWIFASYAPQYTDPVFGFPFADWFDDVWFTNMQQEFQLMMVVSWADLGSRLAFTAGLLMSVDMIKDLLAPVVEAGSNTTNTVKVCAENLDAPVPPISEKQDETNSSTDNQVEVLATSETIPKSRSRPCVHFVLEKAAPACFAVLGVVVLIVHIVAETRQASAGIPCQLQLHAWVVSKPACALVELDCHQLGGLSGSQASMHKAWNTFDFSATSRIIVRHCPRLEVPSALQQYTAVTAFKLYNSTIVSWPVDAAFTATAHANMIAVFAIRTDFPNGELPPGLLTKFPTSLTSFVTSVTNLRSLPDNLHDLWPRGMSVVLEMSQLQGIPPALITLNPSLVSVAGAAIADVPSAFFENPLLECAILGYTHIQELPRQVANPSANFYLMLLQGTNVSTFWSWMDPFVNYSLSFNRGFFNAHGSRYCTERDEIVAGNRTQFSISAPEPTADDLASVMDVSTPAALAFAVSAVQCEPEFLYYFPLSLQDARSAIPEA